MYLDANAHVPILPEVKDFIFKYQDLGHPSAVHQMGRQAAQEIENARNHIANMLGAKSPRQIFFTSGCTQAAEWGLKILKEYNDNFSIYISPLEHVAVQDAAEVYFSNFNKFELNKNFQIQYPNYITNPLKIICIHSHNETGIIQSFNFNKKDIVFADLSQSLGKININLTDLNIDIAIFGAHKFGGPTNVGLLYLRDPSLWREFGTGGRYIMDRSGTPDLLGIKATEIALKTALSTLPQRIENMKSFQSVLEGGLKKRNCRIIAEHCNRLPNTTFFYYKDYAVDKMLKMSERGIHFGLGSACGSVATGISPSLKALGEIGDIFDYARISQWGEYGEKDAKEFLRIFDEVK